MPKPGALCRVWLLLLIVFNASAATLQGRVVGVTDGDTVTVLSPRSEQFKVRLAGIDAPEKKQDFGQRAKEKMSALVFGKPVTVEWQKRDRYGRLVGKVLVGGSDAGLQLVLAGLAWHYKAYAKEQPLGDQESYSAAESLARAKRRGLWVSSEVLPPWEWRRRRIK